MQQPQPHAQGTGGLFNRPSSEAVTIDRKTGGGPNVADTERLAGLFDLGLSGSGDDSSPDRYTRWMPKEGSRVGRYELVRQLGEGGFGIVWLAVQRDDIQREVALKLIKPGMDSRQVTARFEAERQALAVMDHPNIAQVLDAGAAPDANPFFVMELVRGVPITEFCDNHQLTVSERLHLFIQVCNGVQHAHQKAILHRDLKPSNILVEQVDGEPVPKIIDFGIAKALGAVSSRGSQTNPAITGRFSIMGTVQYMSPEQAASESDVDACSDIYSLGTILFELLTGATPISPESFVQKPLEEVLHLIRDMDAPKPSSLFLSGMADVAGVRAAQNRRSDPRRLGQELRGDLDWVVLAALEKDRHRRYESAAAFAQDIRRHLQHELVLARPPTTTYVLGRLIRRNQAAFVSASFITAAVLIACGVTLWSYVKQNEAIKQLLAAEQRAAREKDKGQQVSAFLGDMFQDISLGDDTNSLEPAALRQLLNSVNERRKTQLEGMDNPEADLRMSLMLAGSYLQHGWPDRAAPLYTHALERYEEISQGETLAAADCIRLLVVCLHRHREETGLHLTENDGLQWIDRCIGIFERHLPDAQEKLWEAEALRIGLLRDAGRAQEAESLLTQMTTGPDSKSLADSRASGWFLRERAILLGSKGEADEALEDLNQSIRLLKGIGDEWKQNPEKLLAADASRIRTSIHLQAGDLASAMKSATEEQAVRRALLGHDDPYAAIRLAEVHVRQKNFTEAITRLKETLLVSESMGSLPAQEACLKKLLEAATAEPAKFAHEAMNTRAQLARIILSRADQQLTATGLPDDARLDEAAALLREEAAGNFESDAKAAEFQATRASIAVRREDFPAAIRDLRRADSLDGGNPAHRVGCAIFSLAAGDAVMFEAERAELVKRLTNGVNQKELFGACCAVLLRPTTQAAQLAQVRTRLENYTDDFLDSDRREFVNSFLEFREGGPSNWETARSFLERLRYSDDPEVAIPSRLVMAMGLQNAGDSGAASELREGIRGYNKYFASALGSDTNPQANVIWFVRLLMQEAEALVGVSE